MEIAQGLPTLTERGPETNLNKRPKAFAIDLRYPYGGERSTIPVPHTLLLQDLLRFAVRRKLYHPTLFILLVCLREIATM